MTFILFFMLDYHVVLLLQVDPLDQGLHLVGQPLRTDRLSASEELHLHQDHAGVGPGPGVGQAHLQPVGAADGPAWLHDTHTDTHVLKELWWPFWVSFKSYSESFLAEATAGLVSFI